MKTTVHAPNPEKRLNSIILNDMAGMAADSLDLSKLRTIAQTCLADGGRAVLGARGLCSTWLKEHYSENNCQPAPQGRSAAAGAAGASDIESLQVLPNPATAEVRIRMKNTKGHEEMEVVVSGLDGRQMYRGVMPAENSELTVPVNTWPQGLYVLRVHDGTQVISRTFLVLHP